MIYNQNTHNSTGPLVLHAVYSEYTARHFGSNQQSKLSVTQRKGRYSAVKSSQLIWAEQYKKCVQYDFQLTLEYSDGLTEIHVHSI